VEERGGSVFFPSKRGEGREKKKKGWEGKALVATLRQKGSIKLSGRKREMSRTRLDPTDLGRVFFNRGDPVR